MEKPRLLRKLKLWQVIVLGVAYMVPMALFDSFGIITEITHGKVPAAYLFTLIAILFTAFSYGEMGKVYPVAGSTFTYSTKTLNPHVGFLVGWASLLDYLLMPVLNALLVAVYMSSIIPFVPVWVWVMSVSLILTMLNLLSLAISAGLGGLLVTLQFVMCFVFTFLVMGKIDSSSITLSPLWSSDFVSLLQGSAILTYSFLGFDSVSTFAEELENPKKNISKGIIMTALLGGLIFTFTSYFTQLLYPNASLFKNIAGASPEMARSIGGPIFQKIFVLCASMGVAASGLVSQMSGARLMFAMGRNHRIFGYLTTRTKAPMYNVLLIGSISVLFSFYTMFHGINEAVNLIFSLVSFGALTAFSFVNISVIIHYFVKNKQREGIANKLKYLVSPLLGFLFIITLWVNLRASALTIGLIWSAIGLTFYFMLKVFRKPLGIDNKLILSEEN